MIIHRTASHAVDDIIDTMLITDYYVRAFTFDYYFLMFSFFAFIKII